MKKFGIYFSGLLLLSCGSENEQNIPDSESTSHNQIPIPTAVYENMGDEEAYEEKRDMYFDLIHSHGENLDWKAINAQNFENAAVKRALMLENRIVETFAEGNIEGEWRERGSNDVPGNIRICDFHPATEDIFAISDGGILWQGNIDGETWTPLNDNLQLSKRVIKAVDLPDGTVRIIAARGSRLQYSDDNGLTWTTSEGVPGGTGSGINLVELNDAARTLVYLYNRSSIAGGSTDNEIAYSIDHGTTFTYVADLASSGSRYASMDAAHGSTTAYILDNNDDVYKFEGTTLTLISEGLDLDGTYRCMIQANEAGGELTLYAFMDNHALFKSTDGGITFNFVGDTPSNSWDVGFEVSEDDPDKLYYGEVNLFRSFDGGETWTTVSEWWEYYSDLENKIHADIMSIEPFKKSDGTEITLIANHGGMNISYDNLVTTPNIAIADLNTGQFYDVLTHPNNAALIFGGTQDQGFQRTTTGDSPEPSNFEQVISGDYGQMQFTNEGENIWIQYPGAWFQLYTNAETDGSYSHEANIDGSNMPNVDWIVPTGAAPYATDNFIYVGGGNLDGGSGSKLIKLEYTGSGIESSQYDFDFYDAVSASISGIETTSLDDQMIYVVTENGRFFRSEDAGDSFEMTESYIGPSGSWIYPADIYASRLTPGLVFVGGSGYAGDAVFISRDSAKTFEALEDGLPNTFVHEIVMDPEERFLFAASDAGPYVYDMELGEWFDIAGVSAPLQEYISVEFIPSEYIVRFATWGRGIWDFDLSAVASIEEVTTNLPIFNVFPNPTASGNVSIELNKDAAIFVFDLSGKQVFAKPFVEGTNALNLNHLNNGTYVIVARDENGVTTTEKLVLLK